MNILVINPGSTSTKVAVYANEKPIFVSDITHTREELSGFGDFIDQYTFRKNLVIEEVKRHGVPLHFDAVMGRGGLAKPVEGGVYAINEKMLADTRNAKHKHACDLGCLIAYEIAHEYGNCPCFVADPGSVDELSPEAHVCGLPPLHRICIWHALNQKAIARRFAREHGTTYEHLNLIICHLGGGISIAAHQHGRAIDANNALDGEGPFSPERSGSLPVADLIRLCYSGQYTEEELLRTISGRSGLIALLGTNDMREIEKRIQHGDHHAKEIVDAMVWHIAKAIASEGAVLCGNPDAILLTGGLARSAYIISSLKKRIAFMAPIYVYPGENEMLALALNALSVLKGDMQAKTYE